MLKIADYFQDRLPPALRAWLDAKADVLKVLPALPELFADMNGQTILGDVDKSVVIEGPCFIGKGARIHAHVAIEGPVYIGERVSVRSQAQLRNMAWLGDDCVVGHGADIKYALCLPGSKIQDGTFCGDSVLGSGARIGSGAILANRKFNQTEIKVALPDGARVGSGREFMGAILGDYARIGANCALSPGTVVGPYTWVGSGVVLNGTYGPNLLITLKQELDIRPNRTPQKLRSGRGEYEKI